MDFSNYQQTEHIGFNQFCKKKKNYKYFKINGLVFDNEENFNKLKKYDKFMHEIAKLVKNNIIDINDVFKSFNNIYVEQTYPDAYNEVNKLFTNAASLLIYENTPHNIEYKIACKFFDNIEVLEYDENDEYDDEQSNQILEWFKNNNYKI